MTGCKGYDRIHKEREKGGTTYSRKIARIISVGSVLHAYVHRPPSHKGYEKKLGPTMESRFPGKSRKVTRAQWRKNSRKRKKKKEKERKREEKGRNEMANLHA